MTSRLLRTLRPHRGGRLPLALLALVVAGGVTAAVSDASASGGSLRFAENGHWFFQPGEKSDVSGYDGSAFHVNGSTGKPDAEVELQAMDADSLAVQGDRSGYVVGLRKGYRFGKSTLKVDDVFPLPTGEQPVPLEVQGGPYLVYRDQGRVIRLGGPDPVGITVGAALGDPVATSDGTVWLVQRNSNKLCYLKPDADRPSCGPSAPAGHTGALTVVGRQAVFVDTDDNTFTPVAERGLGRAVQVGRDLPADAKIAAADVAGRVAVVDPGANRLHLLDASGLGDGRVEAKDVTLPAGDYAAPVAGRGTVVLLDRSGNQMLTFDRDGNQQGDATPLPVDARQNTRLTRGADQRVYVAGQQGRRVLVFGDDGRAETVPLVPGKDRNKQPKAPPAETNRVPVGGTSPGSPQNATVNPPPTNGGTTRPPAPPVQPQQPKQPTGSGNNATPTRPPTPPGMPPSLRATASGNKITVTWGGASPNGARVTGYRVTWSGGSSGSRTVSGGSRKATLTGLQRDKTYRIRVAAQNSAGRGTAASASAKVAPAPQSRTVTVSRGTSASHGTDCEPPRCAYTRVVIRGFAPNSVVDIEPYTDAWGRFNPGAELKTNSQGNLTVSDRFPYNGSGGRIWVTVNGYESNHYTWPSS